MTLHFNRRSEREKRKGLWSNASDAEQRLWRQLRAKQLGTKFRRQYSVDAYVLDFYAPQWKLAVEVDGDSHFTVEAKQYDEERTAYMKQFGIEVVRFTNLEILENIEGVLETIEGAVKRRRTTSPSHPPLKGGGMQGLERRRFMRWRVSYWVSLFIAHFLVVLFCISSVATAGAENIRVHSPSFDISVIPLYVARDKGYFSEMGLEASFILAPDNIGVQALIAGEFDFSASATGASRAAVRNIPLKVLLVNTSRPAFWIYAREDLSPLQLKGKKLAISSIGGLSHALAKLALRRAGLDPDREVIMIATGSTDMRLASLQSKAVDAAVLNAPGKFKAMKAGLKEILFLGEQIYALSGGVATTARLIQARPETVQRFVTGALRGLKYFLADREGSIPIMVKHMKVDRAMAKELYETTIQTFAEDGMAGEDLMRSEVQLQASVADVKEVPPFDRPFDLSFARKANQSLKNWKP